MRLSDRFAWGKQTYLMGVINVTPDSFSGDGLLVRGNWVEAAIEHGLRLVADGAHMLDVGGESTRPGAEPIPPREELRRIVPVVEALAELADVPLSIDTTKAAVAAAALDAGAAIINDVSGLRADPELGSLAAERGAPVVLVHNPGSVPSPRGDGARAPSDEATLDAIRGDLQALMEAAVARGVAVDQIILDPGIGFAKTGRQNLAVLDGLETLRALGRPLLISPSRKPFIGFALDLPPDEQLEGSAGAAAVGIVRGADIVRAHDVRKLARVARIVDAIVRRGTARR